ncbi:hypothetical protein P7C73_g2687, partial [Tremellales sp. Uapishka_1]
MEESAKEEIPVPLTTKRKRTGKQREEAKKAAIQVGRFPYLGLGGALIVGQAKLDAEKAEEEGKVAEEQDIKTGGSTEVALAKQAAVDPAVGGAEVDKKSSPDVGAIAKRIPQAIKTLHPLFKQAKTQETQRLIKKVKFLRTKPETAAEVKDLEAQLELLTHLQIQPLTQAHLLLKLRKHPFLRLTSLSEPIISLLTSSAPRDSSSLTIKVENRLCSSKLVSDNIKSVLAWTVGEEGAVLKSQAVERSKRKEIGEKRRKLETAREERMNAMKGMVDVEDDEDDEDEDEVEGGEIEDEEEDGGKQVADDAGWESGSISDGESIASSSSSALPPNKRTKTIPESTSKPKPKALPLPRAPPPSSKPTSSTFLPTLATGFTLGDSDDSDPDMDYDPDGIIGSKAGERKNRRGQRARQAIWEKKYGKNAKHVVKAHEEELTKTVGGRGWGSRGGAAGPGATGARPPASSRPVSAAMTTEHQPPRGASTRGRGGSGASSIRPTSISSQPSSTYTKPAAEKEPALHPSWEAARLRKQKEMAAGVAGAGAAKPTKIVFD